MSDVRTDDVVELGLSHVWGAARRYGDLAGSTPRQKAGLSVSALPRLTGAALAGFLLRSGPVTASVGSDRQFNVILLVQCLLSAAVAVVGATALSLVPSLLPWYYAFLCVLVVGFIVFVLPSRKVHRDRGFMVSNTTWKKRHAVSRFWGINALVHDARTPAAEIAAAIQRLIPDVGPGWAIVVCVANEEQAHAVELLGFSREREAPGILYRIADSGAVDGVAGMSHPQHQQGQASAFPPETGPSLWAPLYTAGPAQAVGRFFKKYAVFHGRASRAEYWWVAMTYAIVSFVLEALRASTSVVAIASLRVRRGEEYPVRSGWPEAMPMYCRHGPRIADTEPRQLQADGLFQ